jgi:hypothetical protein
MGVKAYAAVFCAAAIALAALAVPPAEAQQKKKRYVANPNSNRAATTSRPRARVTVAPRSFLDAGTEVLPGERKFTDYAFPPNPHHFGVGTVTSTGGRVGWDRSPLPRGPWDVPGLNY